MNDRLTQIHHWEDLILQARYLPIPVAPEVLPVGARQLALQDDDNPTLRANRIVRLQLKEQDNE